MCDPYLSQGLLSDSPRFLLPVEVGNPESLRAGHNPHENAPLTLITYLKQPLRLIVVADQFKIWCYPMLVLSCIRNSKWFFCTNARYSGSIMIIKILSRFSFTRRHRIWTILAIVFHGEIQHPSVLRKGKRWSRRESMQPAQQTIAVYVLPWRNECARKWWSPL